MARHPYPWHNALLVALREWPVLSHAASAAGVDRSTVWRAMNADPDLKQAVHEAMEEGVDKAEREAFRRAVEGTLEDVWHQGVAVGQKRVYSDALLGKVLAARRAAYRTQATELSGPDGGPVKSQQIIVTTGVPHGADDFGDLA